MICDLTLGGQMDRLEEGSLETCFETITPFLMQATQARLRVLLISISC
jgi:hypothetical protein